MGERALRYCNHGKLHVENTGKPLLTRWACYRKEKLIPGIGHELTTTLLGRESSASIDMHE